ncbi:hypothetical protein PE067_16620 [Paracoccus sp. DMF-8]|uniref:hypothetical protein n=1 Tax=Paracoccus sp. DMF-8 TaxID=3019445 RepID=UPI0023E3A728|nr:hypothetical protein [Paracoccus sp. DMF-8]MDF3607627.1 hypothetical protein [Paracoccus sp. DMF-8]
MKHRDGRLVSVSLLQPVADLLAQPPMAYYQTDLRGPDGGDTASLYLTEMASGGNLKPTMTGGPIVFQYAARNCTIELPSGRQMLAAVEGPVVARASMVLPMEPMTWDEMQTEVSTIVRMFDDAGWVRSGRPVQSPLRPEDFSDDSGPKSATVGAWRECEAGPARAVVTVQHYNSLTGSSFTPPAVLSEKLPENAPDLFLIYVTFSPATQEISDSLSELVTARRASEGLDPAYQKLPASVWLDDPDWRPRGWSGGF